MSMIQVQNLTFAYPGSYDNIFEDVSFTIDTDWRLGFTGRNGRGKTTFLRLLMGEYDYAGSITSNVAFDYFPYAVPDETQEAGAVIAAVAPAAAGWQIQKELAALGVGEEALMRPFSTLSNGERTKLLLAALFLREGNFLLIDEPTNHLDLAGRARVADYLRGKSGFLLVSHDRAFLDGCVDHILSINRMNIEIQRGNFSSWWENKRRQDDWEAARNEQLKGEIRRLNEAARRTADWSEKQEAARYGGKLPSGLKPERGALGHKAAKMMKRSKSIESRRQSAAADRSALLRNTDTAEPLKLSPQRYPGRLLSLHDVALSYGERQVCSGVTFDVMPGDRVALRGGNGSGKTSLLRLIRGEEIAYTGTLVRGSRLVVSYVPQDTSFLRGNLADYAERCGVDETLFKAILRKLDFSRAQFEKEMADFSGGQKKKVLLARSLCEKAHLYIWDEPLNFIDVLSRIQIQELLLEYAPTLLFVEHDRAFCDAVATKAIDL